MRTYKKTPIAERMAKYISVNPSGCHIWTGCKSFGYGRIGIDGRLLLAHRVAYAMAHGEISSEDILDHLCRTPACVNPDHLEIVTHRENILRGVGPSAQNAKKDRCPAGHLYDMDLPGNRRGCRKCRNELKLRWYHKNKPQVA